MNKKSAITNYLLSFDYLKKVVFIISISIITSLIIILLIIYTYSGLIHILEKQLTGLQYHNHLMSIYDVSVYIESQLEKDQPSQKSLYSAQLIAANSSFSNLIQEVRDYILEAKMEDQAFYLQQMDQFQEEVDSMTSSMQENELNPDLNSLEIDALVKQFKESLFSFSQLMYTLFQFQLHTNLLNYYELDLLTHRLPLYKKTVSDILFLFPAPFTNALKAELFIQQTSIEENLNSLYKLDHEVVDDNYKKKFLHSTDKGSLEKFLKTATIFSNLLSSKIFDENSLKEAWNDLKELGFESIQQEIQFYQANSKALQNLLSTEIQKYQSRKLISSLLLILGIFLVLSPYLMKAFRNPLAELKEAAEKLANGDLSVRIPLSNPAEVKAVSKSFNETAEVFEQIMLETNHFAIDLSQRSTDLFSTAKMLEESLTLQEATIYEINQNSKNILKTVHDFSRTLDLVNETIEATAKQIGLSRDSLSELESIIQLMGAAASNTVSALSSIASEVDKIHYVINTLIIIADQVNLLSLNTSIRANKSGLKKLGFNVIADKIQELADQTAYATIDIEEIVQEIHAFVPTIVNDIDLFNQEIQEALQDSYAVREQFQKLLSMTQTQIASFQIIDKGMQDQAEKTYAIDKAITDLTHSTEKTTRSVRTLYIEIENLYLSTKNLLVMTKKFTSSTS